MLKAWGLKPFSRFRGNLAMCCLWMRCEIFVFHFFVETQHSVRSLNFLCNSTRMFSVQLASPNAETRKPFQFAILGLWKQSFEMVRFSGFLYLIEVIARPLYNAIGESAGMLVQVYENRIIISATCEGSARAFMRCPFPHHRPQSQRILTPDIA